MKLKKIIIVCLLLGLSLVACNNDKENVKEQNSQELTSTENIKTEEENGNTIGNYSKNINDGGYVAYQNGWFYYSNENGLYKMDENGENRECLSSDRVEYINVVGEWIYYDTPKDGFGKIKTDGTGKIALNESGEYMNVIGEWIYFSDTDWRNESESGIYRMKTDGTKKEFLMQGWIGEISIVDDWIYCYREHTSDNKDGIYKVKTDGTKKQLVYTDEYMRENEVDNLFIEGEWIYYNKRYTSGDGKIGIYRVKNDGSECQPCFTILDTDTGWERIEKYSVHEGKIYYELHADGIDKEYIQIEYYQINSDGTEKEILKEGVVYDYFLDDYKIVRDWDWEKYSYSGKYDVYDKNNNQITLE